MANGEVTDSAERPRPPEVPNTLVHFYRATVMHADVWRQRLDATTNWAVVSSAAIVTFAFSDPANPHFILLLAIAFSSFFLTMESRRYQMYDLWRQRVRMLNRYLIAPALDPSDAPERHIQRGELAALAVDLGSTIPHLSFLDAAGYRIRRNYLLLFGAVLATWLLKLWYHPVPTSTWGEYVLRATIGLVPGPITLGVVGLLSAFVIYLAFRARTERMEAWTELPSPLNRALAKDAEPGVETSLLADSGLRTYERPEGGAAQIIKRIRGSNGGVAGVGETTSIDLEPDAEEVEHETRESNEVGENDPALQGETADAKKGAPRSGD